MSRIHKLIFLLIISITMYGCSSPFSKKLTSGIQVNADPESSVFIDNQYVGKTNYYNDKIKPGDHLIKIVSNNSAETPYETKIKLVAGLTSVVYRYFGSNPIENYAYTIQLEKIPNKKTTEITVVTIPENVIVRLDEQPKGFTPLTNVALPEGKHTVTLVAPGYKTVAIETTTSLGYRVIVSASLGKQVALLAPTASFMPETTANSTPSASPKPSILPSPSPTPSSVPTVTSTPKPSSKASPTPSPRASSTSINKPYVEIGSTPTGWLRVRSEPNGLVENELAKVNTGDKFPFIEQNDTGWYKIEYEPGKLGWIAATYSKLVK